MDNLVTHKNKIKREVVSLSLVRTQKRVKGTDNRLPTTDVTKGAGPSCAGWHTACIQRFMNCELVAAHYITPAIWICQQIKHILFSMRHHQFHELFLTLVGQVHTNRHIFHLFKHLSPSNSIFLFAFPTKLLLLFKDFFFFFTIIVGKKKKTLPS